MITLDVNLRYLTEHYDIGAQKLSTYRGKSIKEIMEIESEQGNSKAAHFLSNILSNPDELIKIFQLLKPENRFEIINNMSFSDKIKMMRKLDKKSMVAGLQFFSKDKICDMLKGVNKVDLLTVGLQKKDFEEFMKTIPEKQMDKFFDSEKIKPKQIMYGLEKLEPEQLSNMISNVSDISTKDCTKKDMLGMLSMMEPKLLKKAVKSLEQKEKGEVITNMAKQEPDVLKEMPVDGFVGALEQMDKEDLLKSMTALEESDLMNMLTELPEELMAVTASQIPAEEFSKILINDFSDVIGNICL